MTQDYLVPLWISLRTVVMVTAVTFFLGIAAARWMTRYSGRFKSVVDGIFILPMVLPPTVVGYGLLLLFGNHGPIGKLLLGLGTTVVFSWWATVIAAVVMAFPLMYTITCRFQLDCDSQEKHCINAAIPKSSAYNLESGQPCMVFLPPEHLIVISE